MIKYSHQLNEINSHKLLSLEDNIFQGMKSKIRFKNSTHLLLIFNFFLLSQYNKMISDVSIVYIKILECDTFKMFANCSLLSSSVEQQQQFEPRNFQKFHLCPIQSLSIFILVEDNKS